MYRLNEISTPVYIQKKKKKSQVMIEETCLQIVLLEGKLFRQRMFCIVMKYTVHFVFVFQKKKKTFVHTYILTKSTICRLTTLMEEQQT